MEQPPYGEGKYDLQLGLYGSDLCGYVNNWRNCVSLGYEKFLVEDINYQKSAATQKSAARKFTLKIECFIFLLEGLLVQQF
ncbi:hypothetical protein H5410_047147 [Solanum commersonii]|uniref:Uncharacterized protein n=1 Tax=Solanum commersonii TaxID=4109 RepID=A0A9J5XE87_SOLCO|nr:hypothetical protein H5410_047147 [Solanum commersonii]